ncbi:hypothetical protein [Legionella londiniensis]|uniref:hypothetical protein n=1 Tax=Legionella londiniensis TaxID=45068 RepID=UPI00399CBB15
MYNLENTIKSVQNAVLNDVKSKLEDSWLRANRSNIEKEVNEKVKEQQKIYDEQYKQDQEEYRQKLQEWQSSIPQHSSLKPNPPLKATAHAFQFEREIQNKYTEQFKSLWEKDLKSIFETQLKQLNAESFIGALLKRHPWLDLGYASEGQLPFIFLEHYLKHQLISLIENPHIKSWGELQISHFTKPNFSWRDIEEGVFQNLIEGYPFHDVDDNYISRYIGCSSYPQFLSQTNLAGSRPTHIDLIRFLYSQDSSGMVAKELKSQSRKGNIYCTKYAPSHYTKLADFDPAQWEHYQSLLVNVGSEQNPLWVLLHKTSSNNWTAYVPNDKQNYASFFEKVPGTVNIHPVDYQLNAKNDDDSLSKENQWHAVLLGRVFPWCFLKSINKPELEKYRHDVPASLLWENVIDQMISHTYWGSSKQKIHSAFVHRAPFSKFDLQSCYAQSWRLENQGFLFGDGRSEFEKNIRYMHMIESFETHIFSISEDSKTFTYQPTEADATLQQQAYKTIYHSPVERLVMANPVYTHGFVKDLATYDINLKTVRPINPQNFQQNKDNFTYPMHAAARNRFLQSFAPDLLASAKNSIEGRQALWASVGKEMISFFQQEPILDLDLYNQVREPLNEWKQEYCDHEQHSGLSGKAWSYAQIAEMGKDGLDALFTQLNALFPTSWKPQYKEPAPNLNATFDLAGSLTDSASDYINHLASKIEDFDKRQYFYTKDYRTRCMPLFKSLSLVFPETLDKQNIEAIGRLLKAVNQRKEDFQEETPEVVLYNLPNNKQGEAFIEQMEELLQKNPNWQLQIRIPVWDREAYIENEEQRKLKDRYRLIQNKIQDNQRKVNHQKLAKQTENIYNYARNDLKAELILSATMHANEQPWDEQGMTYPLVSQAPGIQQQMQQEQQQEMQQEEQQQEEQQQEQEQEQQIEAYGGNEGLLITRGNINENETCKQYWQNLAGEIKDLSGFSGQLSDLFSQWVGSERDARHVIEKIEPEAVKKMMDYAPQFRLGIAKDNLPPGFYLAYSRESKQGLILCFSAKREIDDLRKRADLTLKQRNPFTVELHPRKKAIEFRGDFRQFTPLDSKGDLTIKETLWKYLATEDKDAQRLNRAKQGIDLLREDEETISSEDASVTLQRYEAYKEIKVPGNDEDCLNALKAWAEGNKASKELCSILFNKNRLTDKNLKAFGQLFNFYDVDFTQQSNKKTNGTEHWLFIADQMLETFGEKHFAIWKERLLDPSENWTELLEKEEVDAMALSMQSLKGHKTESEIWWRLVDAHGKATGHMSYAKLWHAYQTLLTYIEQKKLTLNEDAISNYLQATSNFNGLVFCDRLHRVLKNAENQLDRDLVQQHILDNIDKIDWRHNGYYYASRYESYPYWKEGLQLEKLTSTNKSLAATYMPRWDEGEIKDLKTHALRFASERMQLRYNEFDQYQKLIEVAKLAENPELLRLFTASLAIGVNNLNHFKEPSTLTSLVNTLSDTKEVNSDLIVWINKQLLLDKELLPDTLHLRFEDIVHFAKALQQNKIGLGDLQLDDDELEFINACGRALQCHQDKPQDKLARLLKIDKPGKILDHGLFTAYPWLLEDYEKNSQNWQEIDPLAGVKRTLQIKLFLAQLESIDFAKSTYLPSREELREAFSAIASKSQRVEARNTRQEIVNQWIEKGCAITVQDSPFRKLENKEPKETLEFLEKRFLSTFKEHNKTLMQQLLGHVAVKDEGNEEAVKKQLESFQRLMIGLDNKTHYNDLGQVLGLLLQKAKSAKPECIYSLPQLTSWLEKLVNQEERAFAHYPVNLLEELLSHELNNPKSSLLNSNLHHLNENGDAEKQKLVQTITYNDLPNHYKPVLVRWALKSEKIETKVIHYVVRQLGSLDEDESISSKWPEAVCRLINNYLDLSMPPELGVLKAVVEQPDLLPNYLKPVWQESQIKLINLLIDESTRHNSFDKDEAISLLTALRGEGRNAYAIQIILVQAINHLSFNENAKVFLDISNELQTWSKDEAEQLALYMADEPRPSEKLLCDLLKRCPTKSASDLIHEFESVEQAKDKNGSSKRIYSIDEKDREDLARVLKGLKLKGRGYISIDEQKKLLNLLYYTNDYSDVQQLHRMRMEDLKKTLEQGIQEIKNSQNIDKDYASARVLACMREILLRKSGKFANHTQMLDLLYAATHNDESLIHQLRTGQGKSIITIMRSSFLALTGHVVDVFSAKASLSERDHEEFAPVLDAMGIPHAYISEGSPAAKYKTKPSNSDIGAINYATIGNFSLFHSRHIWDGKDKIDLDREKRVAFIDECDHVLKDEQTQFNFSDSEEGNSDNKIYNLDEWVYRITYDFYLKHKENEQYFFPNKSGILTVTENPGLKALCDALYRELKNSPKGSTFWGKYISPAAEQNNEDAIRLRNGKLKDLLTAAHIAHHMEPDDKFCVRPDLKQVSGMKITTRAAKVMINNQVIEGSTYSDLVQQFLHVRLNHDAVEKGQKPDFFVDPVTQIALSQNAQYLLKKYYKKLEGCTGTAGNEVDLEFYEKEYGIRNVIKMPTHEKIRTEFLPAEFAESFNDQIDKLVKQILANQDQPILITCKDDKAVKRIAAAIQKKLKETEEFKGTLTVDTNDSGKSESQVVPLAGKIGAVTISSRLGRGTDIKPESTKGLMVLRTYPAIPRVEKQERGRQGRNGALGTCQDIINYAEVLNEHKALYENHQERLLQIEKEQQQHLTKKLEKNSKRGSQKWKWLEKSEETQNKIVITRATQQLKHELKQEQDKFIRRKENLLAVLSGNVMDVLHQNMKSEAFGYEQSRKSLKTQWLDARKKIDEAWNSRLAGKQCDSEEVYQEFFEKVENIWAGLSFNHRELDGHCLTKLQQQSKTEKKEKKVILESEHRIESQPKNMDAFIQCYQAWFAEAQKKREYKLNDEQKNVLYGIETKIIPVNIPNMGDVDEGIEKIRIVSYPKHHELLFKMLLAASGKSENPEALFNGLSALIKKHGSMHRMPCQSLAYMVDKLSERSGDEEKLQEYIAVFEKFFGHEKLNEKIFPNAETITLNGKLLFLAVNTITTHLVADGKGSASFVEKLITVMHEARFRDRLDDTNLSRLNQIFADNHHSTDVLTRYFADANTGDLGYFINNILTLDERIAKDRIARLHQYLKEHQEKLNQKDLRPMMRPLLAIVLLNSKDYLPDLAMLANLEPVHRGRLLHFMAARLPLDEDTVNELLEKISTQEESQEFIEDVIKPLTSLPLETSLEYINKELQDIDSQHEFGAMKKRLQTLHEAGDYFNQYVKQKNITGTENHHILADLYEKMPCEKAKRFFAVAANRNYVHVPAEDAIELATQFNKESDMSYALLNFTAHEVTALKKLLGSLNKKIQQLEPGDEHKKILFNQDEISTIKQRLAQINTEEAQNFSKKLEEKDTRVADQLDGYFDLYAHFNSCAMHSNITDKKSLQALFFKPNSPSALEWKVFYEKAINHSHLKEKNIKAIAALFVEKKISNQDLAKYFEYFNALNQLDTAKRNFAERILPPVTQDTLPGEETLRLWLDVIQALKDYKGKVTEDLLMNLYEHVCKNQLATFRSKLVKLQEELETVTHDATELDRNNQYMSYFKEYDSPNQEKRAKIMQYLHHGLLDLGEQFKKTCWDHFNKLANSLLEKIIIPESLGGANSSSRAKFKKSFQNLIAFTQEMVGISRHPMEYRGDIKGSKEDAGISGKYAAYFEQQRNRYASFWWTNQSRKWQAESLFSNLSLIDEKKTDKTQFYKSALEQILCTQNDIMENDKNNYNFKGYSRLMDISMQMFVKLAKDGLSQPDIKEDMVTVLNDILESQLAMHIKYLADFMPDTKSTNGFKKILMEYKEKMDNNSGKLDSQELAEFADGLKKNRNSIPYRLQYLANNLEALIALPKAGDSSHGLKR